MESDRKRKAREAFDAWADQLGDAAGTALAAGPVRTVSSTALLAARHWVGALDGNVQSLAMRLDELKAAEAARTSQPRSRRKAR